MATCRHTQSPDTSHKHVKTYPKGSCGSTYFRGPITEVQLKYILIRNISSETINIGICQIQYHHEPAKVINGTKINQYNRFLHVYVDSEVLGIIHEQVIFGFWGIILSRSLLSSRGVSFFLPLLPFRFQRPSKSAIFNRTFFGS